MVNVVALVCRWGPASVLRVVGVTSPASGQVEDRAPSPPIDPDKDPAAVALGRKGGLKGGRARADSLSASERKKIASAAAKKRWEKNGA